jgi:ribosome-binding protein aMBF1 (putative translation factor)
MPESGRLLIPQKANSPTKSDLQTEGHFGHPPPMTRHCWKCGKIYGLEGTPGRSAACEQCRADLHACRNCAHFDRAAAHQCRDRRAEPVHDKETANFCEWFELARREFAGAESDPDRAAKARDDFNKLFGG